MQQWHVCKHHRCLPYTDNTPRIFDEVSQGIGGMLHFEESADLPTDQKQVQNARQRDKAKRDTDECASLLDLSKEDSSVHNLQWRPSPRVVFFLEEQVNYITGWNNYKYDHIWKYKSHTETNMLPSLLPTNEGQICFKYDIIFVLKQMGCKLLLIVRYISQEDQL